jgi:hypothetical protein
MSWELALPWSSDERLQTYQKNIVTVYFILEINENGQDWTSNFFIPPLYTSILDQVNSHRVPGLIHSISTNAQNKVNIKVPVQHSTEESSRAKSQSVGYVKYTSSNGQCTT